MDPAHEIDPMLILEELSDVVAARAAASRAEPPAAPRDGTAGAICRAVLLCAAAEARGLGQTGLDILAPLVSRVLADSAALRAAVRDDPLAAGLETACRLVGGELDDLTAAFARADSPHADVCELVHAEAEALRAVERAAAPAWGVLARADPREGRGRSRPVASVDDLEHRF